MYLVDTSVWIDYLNGVKAQHVDFLDQLLANPLAVGLTELIYMEILQGARQPSAFDRFERYFSGQNFYQMQDGLKSYRSAARIYFDGRRQGITIGSTLDCLIAQCAIENDVMLLHNDRDFIQISKITALRQQCFTDIDQR